TQPDLAQADLTQVDLAQSDLTVAPIDLAERDVATPAELGLPAPQLNAVSPAEGPSTGEIVVTITGADFQRGASVSFGGRASANVRFFSATKLSATLPVAPGVTGA